MCGDGNGSMQVKWAGVRVRGWLPQLVAGAVIGGELGFWFFEKKVVWA